MPTDRSDPAWRARVGNENNLYGDFVFTCEHGEDLLISARDGSLSVVGRDALSVVGSDALSVVGRDARSVVRRDAVSMVRRDAVSMVGSDALFHFGADGVSLRQTRDGKTMCLVGEQIEGDARVRMEDANDNTECAMDALETTGVWTVRFNDDERSGCIVVAEGGGGELLLAPKDSGLCQIGDWRRKFHTL